MTTKQVLKWVLVLGIIPLSSCKTTPSVEVAIPDREQVGALNMPDTIAPVTAPFEMPVFTRPVFNDLSVSIVDYGAQPGMMITSIIQKAIDEVSAKGGMWPGERGMDRQTHWT